MRVGLPTLASYIPPMLVGGNPLKHIPPVLPITFVFVRVCLVPDYTIMNISLSLHSTSYFPSSPFPRLDLACTSLYCFIWNVAAVPSNRITTFYL